MAAKIQHCPSVEGLYSMYCAIKILDTQFLYFNTIKFQISGAQFPNFPDRNHRISPAHFANTIPTPNWFDNNYSNAIYSINHLGNIID
jgi:hypothetical protein